MKRIFSVILCVLLVLAAVPQTLAAGTLQSLENIGLDYNGQRMPFRPADKYTSLQNPPDFTWPHVDGAITYELKIAYDKAMTNVECHMVGINTNYFSLKKPLQHTGRDYYWSARYKTSAGTSAWSNPRRFRIDPDACEFTVPSAKTLLNKIPNGHPRVFVTENNLDEFRALKNENADAKETYDYYIHRAVKYVNNSTLPKEPIRGECTAKEADNAARELIKRMQVCAFAYLLTGERFYGDFAIKAAIELSKWDYKENSMNSYNMITGNDQVHREIAYKTALAYDWLYDLMTESERKAVCDMIVGRLTYKYDGGGCMLDLTESLTKSPFDSHGWTSLAYIGIIAYALKDDVPEASQWFLNSVPFYATMMPPWSYQDGGWCQGTTYWAYSTIESTKELSDVLVFGGVIDLYKKAVAKNENLWTLYAYPHGSYGSYGDGSGWWLAEDFPFIRQSMYELAHFNDDGLALWIAQQQGERTHDNVWGYYAADAAEDAAPPDNLPLGHLFNDVGWAVMTNDLKDPNRIHMTFKSSQYGSFNHSHADQNSFVIQAFGEGLAVHSGHYDRYGSSHDQNITRQSFAHNTITINGGIGQNVFDINAKGSIGEFVNHVEFDSATGKAAEAYGGRLNRFDRNIIYLRPDVYVVIDDLEAKTGEEAEFEWRMNAMSDVSEADNIDGKQNTLLIKKGDANLKTEIMYPYVTFSSNAITDPSTGETTYRFISPIDNKEYAPDGITDVQRMMCFKTGKTSDTKMVAVMSLYQDSEEPPQVVSENYNDYIKLVCKDKTVYANLKKSGESVTTVDGYEFDGSGLTISNTSALLTNGTYLKKDGKLLLSCSRVSTVALGQSELSFSSDDDFKVVITNDNPFFANLSAKTLCDCKERIISSSIGVDCEKNGNESVFNCQKGNYTFIEENIGVISPFSLKAENISVLNNKDGKAAICWEEKQGKTYDVKIGDNVISDVSSPYYFDMEAEAVSVSVREKFGNLLGEWSEDFVYASAYENRLAGNIVFSEAADKVQAKSLSPEGLGNRNMLLCLYNNNILTECVSAEQNGMYLKAEIRKPNINEQVAAYVWDDNYTPVMAKARYKSDSVALTGIYADGKLIDGFSDNKNSYKIYFDRNQRIFPVLYAETADGSTKAKISYDFNEFSAKINVVSQNGETRDIDIKFSSNPDNILHPIKGADRAEDFVLDEGVDADLNGKSSMVSKDSIAYLEFAGDKKIQCNVFTNFKGHENGISGSRAYSDRVPNVGNRLEMECIPGFATGCDYIVLPYGEYYLNYTKLNAENRNSFFNIELSEPAEMYILAVDEHNSLKQDGFLETDTFAQGRYLNPLSPENKYYNLKLNGKSEDYITTYVNSYFYPVKYEGLELWDYVLPLEGFDMGKPEKTYNKYLSEKPGKEQFTLAGDLSSIIERSMKFKYLYKKSFDAGEIRLHLSNEENNGDNMIMIIKEKAPETF